MAYRWKWQVIADRLDLKLGAKSAEIINWWRTKAGRRRDDGRLRRMTCTFMMSDFFFPFLSSHASLVVAGPPGCPFLSFNAHPSRHRAKQYRILIPDMPYGYLRSPLVLPSSWTQQDGPENATIPLSTSWQGRNSRSDWQHRQGIVGDVPVGMSRATPWWAGRPSTCISGN